MFLHEELGFMKILHIFKIKIWIYIKNQSILRYYFINTYNESEKNLHFTSESHEKRKRRHINQRV